MRLFRKNQKKFIPFIQADFIRQKKKILYRNCLYFALRVKIGVKIFLYKKAHVRLYFNLQHIYYEEKMHIVIVTDTWLPQCNGVVTTMQHVIQNISLFGYTYTLITIDPFLTVPLPLDKELRLAVCPFRRMRQTLEKINYNFIHICTEGPLGLAARNYCKKRGIPFTTSFHTQYPEYFQMRAGIPAWMIYKAMLWFHGPSQGIMCSTPSLRDRLGKKGFKNLKHFPRGVDTDLFSPCPISLPYSTPVLLYVGRITVEKNIKAFLDIKMPGTKVVVGDGRMLLQLKKEYPDVVFLGPVYGRELAQIYSSADVLVFPSLTDTFGLVQLEALACGTPVAAYPVAGPLDLIRSNLVGALDFNLKAAIQKALTCKRSDCVEYAMQFSWKNATEQFIHNLCPVQGKIYG